MLILYLPPIRRLTLGYLYDINVDKLKEDKVYDKYVTESKKEVLTLRVNKKGE